ncbi:MAG: isoprenylcysteine carboxylmethyltransferase family protein [Gemmatimonadota bacterium]|nr:isoprenylcysteine carboxylmethyltransferase family protein [Gemmatimonadota bacterium]
MSDQTTFRVMFGALFLSLFAIVGTYRRKAQSERAADTSVEGARLVVLRLAGLVIGVYCLLYLALPGVVNWSFVVVPIWARWLGVVIVLLLFPLVAAAQRALGRNVSPTVITHEDHELVTSGPYRWVRNPLYSAGALLLVGLGLIAASWFLLTVAVLALVAMRHRLMSEEAELEARFGQAYRDYAARTGRFVPRIRQ